MNDHTSNGGQQRKFDARIDQETRELVNQAIDAVPTIGLRFAAAFLWASNVPPEIAIRALVYPNRRRNY